MNQPKLRPGTDADWRRYYETKCREERKDMAAVQSGIVQVADDIRSQMTEWEAEAMQISTTAQDDMPGEEFIHGKLVECLRGLLTPRWTADVPVEQGWYWHWNGDVDCAPLPTSVLHSGTTGKCFVTQGQLGLTSPIDCDQYGGFWCGPIEAPQVQVTFIDAVMQSELSPEKKSKWADECEKEGLLPTRRCPKCKGAMAHYRLGGWKCMRGCQNA